MRQSLKQYANFIKQIRNFFVRKNVLEVSTSYLSSYATTDAYIDSLSIEVNKEINKLQTMYLHTSPEIEMKKLLLYGSGDIYQIAKVFRNNEEGAVNTNEFTMLEWYRFLSVDELITEISELVYELLGIKNIVRITYQEVFLQFAKLDNIYSKSLEELKAFARDHKLSDDFDYLEDIQIFLFTHFIEPQLKNIPVVFITNYPKEQSGLSIVDASDIALRFELYINGIEIANGCCELNNRNKYQEVFINDLHKRKILNKPLLPMPNEFLYEFKNNPQNDLQIKRISGVAVGLDRLFMIQSTNLLT